MQHQHKQVGTCTLCMTNNGTECLKPPCGHLLHEACFAVVYGGVNATTKPCCMASNGGSGDPTKCGTEFSPEWLAAVGLSSENIEKFMDLLDEVFARSQRTMRCPSCETNCIQQNKTDQRMRCYCYPINHKDFCFFCGKVWNSAAIKGDCGNSGCDGRDPILTLIADCETKPVPIGGGQTVQAPQFRLCPHCGTAVEREHETERVKWCKIIHHCPTCLKGFCFSCLDKLENDQIKCSVAPLPSNPYAPCAAGVAPKQTAYP